MQSQDAPELLGVILAAGEGRRFRPITGTYPKSLLPVLDRPLVVRQIEAMRAVGIRDVILVIGHLGDRVVEALGDGSELGVRILYVEQTEMLGIGHAVLQLESYVNRPFLLVLGDIYFEGDLSTLVAPLSEPEIDATIAVRREADPDAIKRNFSVGVDAFGLVREVVEKPSEPEGDLKGCGLYVFPPAIFDACRETPRSELRDEYELTDAIQVFVDGGGSVMAVPSVRIDFNLSEPAELLALNLHCLRAGGHDRFVARDVLLPRGTRIVSTVVLSDARLEAGADLERCLVLPGARVPAGEHRDQIFMGEESIRCD